MTQTEFEKRQERARRETFVIQKTEEGFRVYPPGNPTGNYLVAISDGLPSCTCPDFEHHASDPEWRCKHILAVEGRNGSTMSAVEHGERDGIHHELERTETGRQGQRAPSQMLLKRSVSPDGRIDSLSVEFTCPSDNVPVQEIKRQAKHVLSLQSGIVDEFLGKERVDSPRDTPADRDGNDENAVDARMLRIGGIDTKWGRRLFIHVQVNGDTLKLFGSPKQLATALEDAGYAGETHRIEEGAAFNLPCRVTTKPSDDGRYRNVDAVFPPRKDRTNGRSRR